MDALFLVGFLVVIVGLLVFDLLVVGKNSHVVSFKEAALWSAFWIALALAFSFLLLAFGEKVHGISNLEQLQQAFTRYLPNIPFDGLSYDQAVALFRKNMTINYLSGYFIEKTLSVDNIIVMMMLLTAFSVRKEFYKKVLFWGILGAIILRFIFIFAGAALIERFEWILYIFGAFLVYSGVKMYVNRNKDEKIEPQNHPLVKLLSKRLGVFPRYVGGAFAVKYKGRWMITPLLLVLVMVEFTDVIFALDSIPAIFAVSRDPYIVFFSNIFAIIGLRALFFLLAGVIDKFRFLKGGIAILLAYVGVKLLAHGKLDNWGFKPEYSLFFILGVLTLSVVLSLMFPKKVDRL